MNKNRFKGLGLLILSVVLMTTLLSCSKVEEKNKYNESIEKLEIESSLNKMKNLIGLVSQNIQLEQDYLKDKASDLDYDEFANNLDISFEELEVNFADTHTLVLNGIDELKLQYSKSDEIDNIELIEKEQLVLSTLFQDLYYYHYMILETDLILSLFSDEVASLMTFMADGNITSIEYNLDLENIMTTYSELLVIDNEAVFDNQFLNDSSQIEDTLTSLNLAKQEILDITTHSDIDSQVNDQVYNLFELIERSIQVVDDYTHVINTSLYVNESKLTIENGAADYIEEILSNYD